jgi:hypothetical protein
MALKSTGDLDMAPEYIQNYIDLAPESQTFQELLTASTNEPETTESNSKPLKLKGTLKPHLSKFETDTSLTTIDLDNHLEDIETEFEELTLQLSAELELADFLKSHQVITDSQAEKAVSTLIENSSLERSSVPLTFLNELNLLEHINMDKVLGILSENCSIPFIKVKQFKISKELKEMIKPQTAKKLGIVIFSTFKEELLIAISNPLDYELRKGLEKILKKKIHFYLTSPDEINNFYNS